MNQLLTITIDGACRGNPGLSGIGIVITKDAGESLEYKEYIGKKTNNQAEYASLKKALQIASTIDVEVTILSDSKLIANRRNNYHKMRNKKLKIAFREVSNLENHFKRVIYKYIPRKKNIRADLLANQAIDEYLKYQNNDT